MTLTKPWSCCLLLHIPQSIASVFYLLNMHVPPLSPFPCSSISNRASSSRNDEKIERKPRCQVRGSSLSSSSQGVSLSVFSGLLSSKKNKSVVVSRSLLISLFYVFSPDAEPGRAIVTPDRTRYSPTLLDLA